MTGGPLTRRPWLVGLAASCALYAPALLAPSSVLLPLDHYGAAQPWLGDRAASPPANPILSDQPFDFFAWHEFLVRGLARGSLPLWNPHQALGEPFAGNVQARLLDPATWFVAAVNAATGSLYGWTLSAVLRAALSFFFVARLVRLLGGGGLGALLGAAAYAFCGFSVLYVNHPMGHVAPWVAAGAYAAARLRRDPGGREVAGVAAAVALSIGGGHPESTLVGLVAIASVFLLSGSLERRSLGRLLLALALGCSLAAPVLLPFVEYLANGGVGPERAGARRLAAAADAPLASVPWTALGALLLLLARRAGGRSKSPLRRAAVLPCVAAALLCVFHFGTRASGGESLLVLLWPAAAPAHPTEEFLHLPMHVRTASFVGLPALLLVLGALADAARGARREPFAWLWLLALADFLEEPACRLLLHGAWPGLLLHTHYASLAAVFWAALVAGRGARFETAAEARETAGRLARGGVVAALLALGVFVEDRAGPWFGEGSVEEGPAQAGRAEAVFAFPAPGASVGRRLVAQGVVATPEPIASLDLELLSARGASFRRACDRFEERPGAPPGGQAYAWFVFGWNTAGLPRGTYRLAIRAFGAGGKEWRTQPLEPIRLERFHFLSGGRFAAILAIGGAALAAAWLGRPKGRALGGVLLAAAAGDLAAAGFGFNGTCPAGLREQAVRDPLIVEVRERVGHDRVLTDGKLLPPESATLVGLRDVWNYDAIHPARTLALLREIVSGSGASPQRWGSIGLDHPKLPLLGLGGLIGFSGGAPPGSWRLVRERGPVRFLAREGNGGRAFLAAPDAPLDNPAPAPDLGRIAFVEDGPDRVRLEVEASRPALLVLADTFFPGWRARVDGKPVEILPVAGAVRGLRLPADAREVEFLYVPLSFSAGLLLSALAGGVLGLLWMSGRDGPVRATRPRARSSPPPRP